MGYDRRGMILLGGQRDLIAEVLNSKEFSFEGGILKEEGRNVIAEVLNLKVFNVEVMMLKGGEVSMKRG
ncbi:hypothetical protein MA16_Dca029229 [Dendrobium catenatum]|uniref:Uncharacterized protein n=1 Tax=Dendrobium catenatum TaxID=906689 RepID=A0A2I0VBL2_9ASPA|nr:hypothetical protein MA16_Dca029229 [Dendrobium catenatum]